MKQNIAILGAGNLGLSIGEGVVEKKLVNADQVTLTRRNTSHISGYSNKGFIVSDNNLEAVKNSQIIMLCVQPKQVEKLIDEIRPALNDDHIIVSVITGVEISQLQEYLQLNIPVIRCMPNTAVAIGQSMTCICTNGTGKDHLELIQSLFETVGKTLVIEERLMKAATVLGASGIAFFMRYLRAATQGGIQMGFHPEEAQLIAVQTASGAASLVLENETHPEVEIDKVTTPEGCTIAGLNEMEHSGLSSALIKGLMVSYEKIKNIRS
ncbi:MAG: pyrroline-5-carboxylate reductase [bacterium]|nr:pyrroline-5-carboxylate reductase [bacterium]